MWNCMKDGCSWFDIFSLATTSQKCYDNRVKKKIKMVARASPRCFFFSTFENTKILHFHWMFTLHDQNCRSDQEPRVF
jgi:hypothetical protein